MTDNLEPNHFREKVYNCIYNHFEIDVSNIPIIFVNNIDFYKVIKTNYKLSPEYYEDIDAVKKRYEFYCRIIRGLYKWKEGTVYIKEDESKDMSLLLVELLHSKSITQGHSDIKSWIREGLTHFLGMKLCTICGIEYSISGYRQYFPFWEKLFEKYGQNTLKTIIFSEDLKNSISILKSILNYEKDDILELSFEKVKQLII